MKGKQKAFISCEVIPPAYLHLYISQVQKAGFLVHYLPVWTAVLDLNSLNTSFYVNLFRCFVQLHITVEPHWKETCGCGFLPGPAQSDVCCCRR